MNLFERYYSIWICYPFVNLTKRCCSLTIVLPEIGLILCGVALVLSLVCFGYPFCYCCNVMDLVWNAQGISLVVCVIALFDAKQLYYLDIVFYLLALRVNSRGSFLFSNLQNHVFQRGKYSIIGGEKGNFQYAFENIVEVSYNLFVIVLKKETNQTFIDLLAYTIVLDVFMKVFGVK